jgi:hypothetical protein
MLQLRVRVRGKESNLISTVAGIVHNAVNLVQTHAAISQGTQNIAQFRS